MDTVPGRNPIDQPPASPLAAGAYKVWPADSDGKLLPIDMPADPGAHDAVDLYFGVLDQVEAPPKEQMDLQDSIGQVLDTVRKLYLRDNGEQAAPFRLFYVRLFRLAQLGLEGNAVPEAAKAALDRLTDDLLRAEGPRVKNLHLKILAKAAAWLAVVALLAYGVMSFKDLDPVLLTLGINRLVARCFAVLWAGCFIGVWLSYAIRKSTLKLRDLTVAEDDFLEPVTRLVFAGLLANLIALLLLFRVVEIKIGSVALHEFHGNPTVALLLGMLLGVNELLLSNTVTARTRELVDKI